MAEVERGNIDNSSETGKSRISTKNQTGGLWDISSQKPGDSRGTLKKLTPTFNPHNLHEHGDTYFGNTLTCRHLRAHLFLAKTNNTVNPTSMTKHILGAVKLLSQTLMS